MIIGHHVSPLTHKNFSPPIRDVYCNILHYILQILIHCVHEYVFGCVYMCISVCFVTHVHQCYINWIWNLWEYNFIARLAVWLSLFCDKVLIIFLPHEIFIHIFHGSAFCVAFTCDEKGVYANKLFRCTMLGLMFLIWNILNEKCTICITYFLIS